MAEIFTFLGIYAMPGMNVCLLMCIQPYSYAGQLRCVGFCFCFPLLFQLWEASMGVGSSALSSPPFQGLLSGLTAQQHCEQRLD